MRRPVREELPGCYGLKRQLACFNGGFNRSVNPNRPEVIKAVFMSSKMFSSPRPGNRVTCAQTGDQHKQDVKEDMPKHGCLASGLFFHLILKCRRPGLLLGGTSKCLAWVSSLCGEHPHFKDEDTEVQSCAGMAGGWKLGVGVGGKTGNGKKQDPGHSQCHLLSSVLF